MFVLSYVNVLCIYPRLCLHFFLLKAQNQLDNTSMFYSYLILLIYVKETIFAWKSAFFQDSCQSFYGPG